MTAAVIAAGLTIWCGGWAPHVTEAEIAAVAKRVSKLKGKRPADDVVGRRLRLSDADRSRLKITAIGAYDVNRKARAARRLAKKRERDRKRSAAKRVAKGAVSRQEYLAKSLSRAQPWLALGISRRTYYRRQKLAA